MTNIKNSEIIRGEKMEVVLVSTAVIGVLLIIISFLFPKEKRNREEITITKESDKLLEQREDNLIKTINEADDAIEQLNDISKQIFLQQEEKYQELLYLYEIIEQKKKELTNISENEQLKENLNVNQTLLDNTKEDINKEAAESISKYDEIFKLNEQGYSITEIAKKLNMGQGEVNLVLELKKRGEYNKK